MTLTYVTVKDSQFYLGDKPYFFIGANLWYGMHLAANKSTGAPRLVRELDRLADLGVTNLRVMASSEGPITAKWCVQPALQPSPGEWAEEILTGLDFLLSEMKKRSMYAVMCLNNFWPWSGGMAQYVAWVTGDSVPYPPPEADGSWLKYMNFVTRFYLEPKCQELYKSHIKLLINRTNHITGLIYRDDPTIMAWQLANEPRGMLRIKKYRAWIGETAEFIKSLDHNHLLSVGSEGKTPSNLAGNRFVKDHQIESVDYCTIHIWPQNWFWYNPKDASGTFVEALSKSQKYYEQHLKLAQEMKKPLVLEEFGLARTLGNYQLKASTGHRDIYYQTAMSWVGPKQLAGCNFWTWSGEGRPREEGGFWQVGDPLIGDPPHEHQGWYGVYDVDASTLEIIQQENLKLRQKI